MRKSRLDNTWLHDDDAQPAVICQPGYRPGDVEQARFANEVNTRLTTGRLESELGRHTKN